MYAKPEDTIRRYLDEHGGETGASLDHLLVTFGVEEGDQLGRTRISEALSGAGIETDRPLAFLPREESVRLSVTPPKPTENGFPPPEHGTPAPPGAPAASQPPKRGGFFGWASRKPKVAFFATLGVALLVGIGIGAASQPNKADNGASVSDLQAKLSSAQTDLGTTKSDLSSTQGQLQGAQDSLQKTKDRLSTAKDKLKAATATPAPVSPAPAPSNPAPRAGGGSGGSFSGDGQKNVGTITVPVESVLKWQGGGGLFTIFNDVNDSDTIDVSSTANSGETTLASGTYHKVDVLASGGWSFTITPK